MAFEGTDFVDTDYSGPRTSPPAGRAPTREELDAQLTGTQQQLVKLREAQEQLERTRAAVEETRRRHANFTAGRGETLQSLTRGIGLLEKAEQDARRDAEQLARTLEGLRGALSEVERLNEQSWTSETWEQELTRALTTIENARLEFQSACRKWPVLEGKTPGAAAAPSGNAATPWSGLPVSQLFRLGLALTWPLVLAMILLAVTVLWMALRR
ncbi:MAG: hypothetical protein KIT22_15090 [Verrucomicrobiae bacterium]|nr:hypothetical protein [Verrucomicrobiae bacterium]